MGGRRARAKRGDLRAKAPAGAAQHGPEAPAKGPRHKRHRPTKGASGGPSEAARNDASRGAGAGTGDAKARGGASATPSPQRTTGWKTTTNRQPPSRKPGGATTHRTRGPSVRAALQ